MKQRKPKISVIVATYNQEGSIARTLDSILSQECEHDYEIIIGEDCSSDHTADICREYESKYPEKIKLLANKHNKGLIDNYFDCLLEASGEYIADCAGDDFWIDNRKLSKQCQILDSDSSIVLVHTGWNCYDNNNGSSHPAKQNSSPYHRPIIEKGELLIPILRRDNAPIVHLCTAMYRRDTLLKIYQEDINLFRNKEFTCEDLQICAALSTEGRFAYIPDTTLNYSIGISSMSSEENNLKSFNFCLGTIKLTRYLQAKYSVPQEKLINYYRADIHYIITRAFNGGYWDKCKIAKNLALKYGINLPLKSQILTTLSSIALIRDIALYIKNKID